VKKYRKIVKIIAAAVCAGALSTSVRAAGLVIPASARPPAAIKPPARSEKPVLPDKPSDNPPASKTDEKAADGYMFLKSYYANGAGTISYADAMKQAIAANSSVENLSDSARLINQNIKVGQDTFMSNMGLPYATVVNLLVNLKSLEANADAARYSERMLKESAEYVLLSAVTDLETKKIDIALLERSVGLGEQNAKNLELQVGLGVKSQSELEAAKLSLQADKANLAALKMSADGSMTAINRALGRDMADKSPVAYKPDETKMNPEKYIVQMYDTIDDAPTVKSKEFALEAARYAKSVSGTGYDWVTGQKDMFALSEVEQHDIQLENDVNSAERALSDARADLEKTIRGLCDNISQLESARKALEAVRAQAVNTYNNALLSFKAGNIIEFQVKQAELGVMKAEADIEKNKISYDSLRFLAERPYLAAGAK
jgi:hypothetical protein